MTEAFGKDWRKALHGTWRGDGWLGQHRAFRPPDAGHTKLDSQDWPNQQLREAAVAVRDALDAEDSPGLVFLGPQGTGKTRLQAVAFDYYLQRRAPRHRRADNPECLWIDWHAFVRCMLSDKAWRASPLLDEIVQIGRVVIDDVPLPRSADEAELFSVLTVERHAYWQSLSAYDISGLSITSNLTPTELRQAFGDRVFDRLRERALWLAFKGKSLRQSLAAEELADLRARIESEEDDE